MMSAAGSASIVLAESLEAFMRFFNTLVLMIWVTSALCRAEDMNVVFVLVDDWGWTDAARFRKRLF